VFATYYREGSNPTPPPPAGEEGLTFTATTLNLFHKITLESDVIGTVLIQSDLRLIRDRLQTYLGIIGFVMLSSVVVAFLLSLKLQKLISGPILHLADTANSVASEKKYSIRAEKTSNDEMGVLIDRFNEMLSGIEERDAKLLAAQMGLEKRVDERTKELQLEISERARVQDELRISRQKFETLSIPFRVWCGKRTRRRLHFRLSANRRNGCWAIRANSGFPKQASGATTFTRTTRCWRRIAEWKACKKRSPANLSTG